MPIGELADLAGVLGMTAPGLLGDGSVRDFNCSGVLGRYFRYVDETERLLLRGEGLKNEAERGWRTSRSTGILQRPHASLIAMGLVEHDGRSVWPEDVTG